MTDAMVSGMEKPELSASAMPMGVISVMVPTDVPIAMETRQATTKSTTTANRAGIRDSMKYATLCAELLPTTPTKMPASMKISSMIMMFLSPTPEAMISIL